MMSLALLILVLTSWVAFVLPDSSGTGNTAGWVMTGGVIVSFVCVILHCRRQPTASVALQGAVGLGALWGCVVNAMEAIRHHDLGHWSIGLGISNAAADALYCSTIAIVIASAFIKDRYRVLLWVALSAFLAAIIGRTWSFLIIPLHYLAWSDRWTSLPLWIGIMIGLDLWQLPLRVHSLPKRIGLAAIAVAIVLGALMLGHIDSEGPRNTYSASSLDLDRGDDALLRRLEFGNQWVQMIGSAVQRGMLLGTARFRSQLTDYQDAEQQQARNELSERGIHRVLPRITSMVHRSGKAAEYALEVLGRSGDIKAVPPLIQMLGDQRLSPDLRSKIAWALGSLIAAAPQKAESPPEHFGGLYGIQSDQQIAASRVAVQTALIGVLDNEPRAVRVGALYALAKAGGDAAFAQVMKASKDKDPDVRRAAVAGIGDMNANGATDALIRALSDPDCGVRLAAASGLGTEPSSAAIPALTKALEDKDGWVAMNAVRALARTRDKSLIPVLKAARDSVAAKFPVERGDTLYPPAYREGARRYIDERIEEIRQNEPISEKDFW